MRFYERLEHAWEVTNSLVCVGLDPDETRLPDSLRGESMPFLAFNRRIVDATAPFACAFKPQFAYYAGAGRLDELALTISYIKSNYPDHVVILDSKRGDIGATAVQYAREAFEVYQADAVTVNPYMGGDTLEPFTRFEDRGVFVLCKTSNPGSRELQNRETDGRPLYLEVARRACEEWNQHGNLGLVAGATYPGELQAIRESVGDMPLLVPGIGAQGGDLQATLEAGLNARGRGLLINSSRNIIFAGSGEDFDQAAAKAARELSEEIRSLLN